MVPVYLFAAGRDLFTSGTRELREYQRGVLFSLGRVVQTRRSTIVFPLPIDLMKFFMDKVDITEGIEKRWS